MTRSASFSTERCLEIVGCETVREVEGLALSSRNRYLADASYWLYLVHLPFSIWMPGLMNGWNVSAFLKSGITFTITTCFCVVTYHYLVRSTAIGVLLSGKRYPRRLPRFDDAGRAIDPDTPTVPAS